MHRAYGLIVILCLCGQGAGAAEGARPGYVAGKTPPVTDPPPVPVEGGWLVPYEEQIPGTSVRFHMVPVPGGILRIGSPADEAGRDAVEGPQCSVAVSPFWIGRCEVTWSEYKVFMGMLDLFKAFESAQVRLVTEATVVDAVTAPSSLYDPTTTFTNGEDPLQPAVTMTQYSARQYTKWLSLLTGHFYRLPSEAEWEYACRAGSDTAFACEPDQLAEHAWFVENAEETTHPVGQKRPNSWGIHDMHGNVAEWVIDQLEADGYARIAALPQPVPSADAIAWPTELSPRVVRGGAYYDEPDQCRSAARRGSEDEAWKDVDPNLPKSPWWYTEEPALGVGMRIVRPYTDPDASTRQRWWKADIESIQVDTEDRLSQGRGALGLVDPKLPIQAKELGFAD